MMKGIFLDDNLTSAESNEANLSCSSNRNEVVGTMYPPPQSFASVPITTNNNQTQSNKKKRNLPGNPDPEAEVVALSPKSLMATNRFMCEICNKGFQRDQNLQLHRRGHNLPWKLKQRSKLEVVKKKVYVCPEPSCVHHDPARALGDLTGIKKHFSRKHGEKKWKCEKCSKRYAVQSDWKAHSKICGTREYRCDCGTLFSRRDSFITHRAFCDALAEETGKYSSSSTLNSLHHQLPINFPLKTEPQVLLQHPQLSFNIGSNTHQLPSWLNHHQEQENPNPNELHLPCSSSSHMSATALLQKAAQMGVKGSHQTLHHDHMCAPMLSSHHHVMLESNAFANVTNCMDQLLDHSSSLTSTGVGSSSTNMHEIFNTMFNPTTKKEQIGYLEHAFPHVQASAESVLSATKNGSSANNELTRDFLGLCGFPNPSDQRFLDLTDLDHMSQLNPNHNQNQNRNQNQIPWRG